MNNKIINITGGIGSGKSSVAKIVNEMGYEVIFSDEVAKVLMIKDEKLKVKIIKEFGDEFYNEDGSLNTKKAAEIVFGESKESKKKLEKLNSLVHPAVIEHNINKVEELFEEGEEMVFIESALTFEIGLQDVYDYILVVDAPKEVCIERTMKRSSISREQVLKRMENQFSMEEKKKHADFIIDNSKDIESLKTSTNFMVELLKDLPQKQIEED